MMVLRRLTLCMAVIVAAPIAAQVPAPRTLTAADADGEIAVLVGQSLVIRLVTNASTGREWRVVKSTNATVDAVRVAGGGTGGLGASEIASVRVGFRAAGRASVMLGEFGPRPGDGPEQVLHYHFSVAPAGARMRAR